MYQKQLEQLEQERRDLEHLLEEREHQLATFKNSLAALNAEYWSDLVIVKLEASELGEQVKERDSMPYLKKSIRTLDHPRPASLHKDTSCCRG